MSIHNTTEIGGYPPDHEPPEPPPAPEPRPEPPIPPDLLVHLTARLRFWIVCSWIPADAEAGS